MMLKQKSNPWARLKYLYVLPLAAVTVAAFARPEVSRELERISEQVEQAPRKGITVVGDKAAKQQDGKAFDIKKKDKPLLRPLELKPNMRPAKSAGYAKPDPLVFIDGTEYEGGMNGFTPDSIDANEIESITVLKNEKALEKFGERARAAGGVILITTKRASLEKYK